ncbi:MAG TPA: type II toxin-antitoxin system HicB family antitoxin [Solirubrobacterales bacterium]|nr:type II toxin-antitoxin system HicB family antitoxin [Solirubrobacterales bacterium]
MKPIRVIYHQEDEGWWAESPDVKGWTAVADTYTEIVKLAEEGIPFALEREAEIEHVLPAGKDLAA